MIFVFLPSPLTGLLNKGRMCIARGSEEELRATIWKISWRKYSASKKLVNEIMISLIGNLQDLYLLPRLRSTWEACYEGGLTWCHYLESPFTLRSVPVWMINYTIPLFEGCGTLKVFTRLSNALRWCCLKIYILGWGIRWWSNEINRISWSTSRFKFCHKVEKDKHLRWGDRPPQWSFVAALWAV